MNINTYLQHLTGNYLFTEIANRSEAYIAAHPDEHLLRLGIGDVTRPLPAPIIEAMHRATDELSRAETFRGYSPEIGYEWLRNTIVEQDYRPLGIDLSPDEVFVSDGAGSDLGNLSELFDEQNSVAILNPAYPAYVDTSLMAGRKIIFLPCLKENNFVPELPHEQADIIYLCFPNNPTGTTLARAELKRWVDYARSHGSIIIFDAAYEAFITDPRVPHSIYEIEGAQEVAIEVRSYSKSAGFTAVRCGWTVVPKATGLQTMWMRRQCTKYNGTSYVAQRAAEATYTAEGKAATRANIDYYLQTAQLIREGLQRLGFGVYGGQNAPYIWCQTPDSMPSWDFFDLLLRRCQVVCTPGVGFGSCGEGFVRFSAFSCREDCIQALKRIEECI